MDDLIAEAKALCEAATPGPWIFYELRLSNGMWLVRDNEGDLFCFDREGDARFIARARELVPELAESAEFWQGEYSLMKYERDEWKARAEAAEAENKKLKEADEIWEKTSLTEIVKDRDEWKARAEEAERKVAILESVIRKSQRWADVI